MTLPNVLWISTHDINPHLGTYAGVWPGAEFAHTPNLDRLAAEGVRYDNAFATAPVCAPSRSSIMTGCFPMAIGTMHMRTKAVPPPEVHLLTEYFRTAGYWTSNNFFTDFQVQTPPTAFDECGPNAHWRNRPSEDTPFFAAFHGMITHESQIYLDDQAFANATSRVSAEQRHDPDQVPLPPYYPDTEVFRTAWARYYDLITQMDAWVGDLLDQLEQDGLADYTIVVFWSDHGVGLPRAKRWANESGLHEPLLIRWPGKLSPGIATDDLIHLMDLAPTMLDICGIPVPEHMQANSFLDADGQMLAPNDYVFGGRDRMDEQEDSSRTVRDKQFRYIRHRHPDRAPMGHLEYADHLETWRELRRLTKEEANQQGSGEPRTLLTPLQRSVVGPDKPAEELYDISVDPHETTNLADRPQLAGDLQRLRSALDAWITNVGDLGLLREQELIEQWRPGGQRRHTDIPRISADGDRIVVTCETPGASIGWTTDAPGESSALDFLGAATGSPINDGRYWRLYSEPIEKQDGPIWFGAWRLGYEPSEQVCVSS